MCLSCQGVCVKTKDLKTGQKFFINFCHSDDVPEPQLYYSDDELRKILSCGTDGEIDNVRIPISIGEKNVVTDTGKLNDFGHNTQIFILLLFLIYKGLFYYY